MQQGGIAINVRWNDLTKEKQDEILSKTDGNQPNKEILCKIYLVEGRDFDRWKRRKQKEST